MVTVIIPTYNRATQIERAINSVLIQTYQKFELIVVDDNNPDTPARKNLEKVMEKYKNDTRIIYLQHEKNKNGAAARNTGIKQAHGEYITFLDDDDFYLPTRLEKMVKALENNQEYDAIYTSSLSLRGNYLFRYTEAKKKGNLMLNMLMQDYFFGTGSNMFFRAEVLKEINGFDEQFLRHQDVEVMIRFFRKHKILNLPELLVVKCEEDRQNVPNLLKAKKVKELFLNTFSKDIKTFKTESNYIYFINYYELLKISIRENNKVETQNLKNIIEKYGKITLKMQLKLFLLKVNKYISLEKIKYLICHLKLKNSLPKDIIMLVFKIKNYSQGMNSNE